VHRRQHTGGTAISVVGKSADARSDQTSAFRGTPGSSADRCIRVGDYRNVRSGGFVAGSFAADEQLFTAAYQQARLPTAAKIYWIPLHVGHMPRLTVQAILLGAERR
jgi:hypothetical protein